MASTDDIELDIGDIMFTESDNNNIRVSNDSNVEEAASPRIVVSNENDVETLIPVAAKDLSEEGNNVEEAVCEKNKRDIDVSFNQKPEDESKVEVKISFDGEHNESVEVLPNGDGATGMDLNPHVETDDNDNEEVDFTVKQKQSDDGGDEEFDFTVKQKQSDDGDDEEFDFTLTQKPQEMDVVEEKQDVVVVSPPPEPEETKLENGKDGAANVSEPPGEAPSVVNEASADVEDEWEHVKTVHLDSDKDSVDSEAHSMEIIGSSESFDYLTGVEGVPSLYRNEIQTSVKRGKLRTFIHWITTPKLRNIYVDDRNAIFCLAKHPYNSSDNKHFQMVASVYMALTGTRMSCQKFGSHWESIGFQGNDPGTDFRGTGILGLLCLVHMCCDCCLTAGREEEVASKQRLQIRTDLYQLARNPEQNFPLALMSINWTRISLQVLREGLLNKLFNHVCSQSGTSLWQTFLELHSAIAYRFVTIWRHGHKTIADSGTVLSNLETHVRQKSELLFSEWQEYLGGGPQGNNAAQSLKKGGRGEAHAVGATAGQGSGQIEFSKLD